MTPQPHPPVASHAGGPQSVSTTYAREHLAEIIDIARIGRAPVYLTRHDRRIAAIVDADVLDWLIAVAADAAVLDGTAPDAAGQPLDEPVPGAPGDETDETYGFLAEAAQQRVFRAALGLPPD